jgi:hypothetical protein
MAIGIDDALVAAAAAINLADTLVETVKKYQKGKVNYDLGMLLREVKVTAIQRIDEADLALARFERMLEERDVDTNKKLDDVIRETPFWHPFESYRLSQVRKRFNDFADSVYSACDGIAALVRCQGQTGEMGEAVVESSVSKHELFSKLLNAGSLKEAINLLRDRLSEHKKSLDG